MESLWNRVARSRFCWTFLRLWRRCNPYKNLRINLKTTKIWVQFTSNSQLSFFYFFLHFKRLFSLFNWAFSATCSANLLCTAINWPIKSPRSSENPSFSFAPVTTQIGQLSYGVFLVIPSPNPQHKLVAVAIQRLQCWRNNEKSEKRFLFTLLLFISLLFT